MGAQNSRADASERDLMTCLKLMHLVDDAVVRLLLRVELGERDDQERLCIGDEVMAAAARSLQSLQQLRESSQ